MNQIKQRVRFAAIVAGIIILCAGTGYAGYLFSQYTTNTNQQDTGYLQGRTEGEKLGTEKGFQEGYATAIQDTKPETAIIFTIRHTSR